MRKTTACFLACLMIACIFVGIGSDTAGAAVTGSFPDRTIDISKKSSASMKVSSSIVGEWWVSVEAIEKSSRVIVYLLDASNDAKEPLMYAKLGAPGSESPRFELIPGLQYTAVIQLQARPGVAILKEHFVSTMPHLQPATFSYNFAANDAVFDPSRPLAYVSDSAAKKVYIANLTNGGVDKFFSFNYIPETMAISPDASTLYVSLLTQPHSPFWWEPHTGYVACIDLATQTKAQEMQVDIDPGDILATSDGWLVIGDGSGQWTSISVYDAVTGEKLGTSGMLRQNSRLTLHPSERIVYAADIDVYPSDIERYDLSDDGSITYAQDSPYHGSHRMNGDVWASTLGDTLITKGGDVFSAGMPIDQDMVFIKSLPTDQINTVFFDTQHNTLFTGEGADGLTLRYYNLQTLMDIDSKTEPGGVFRVQVYDDMLAAVLRYADTVAIEVMNHPLVGGGSNTAPVPSLTVTPAAGGSTQTEYEFNASSSTDAQDPLSSLQFRWDFNSDGVWDTSFSSDPVAIKKFDIAGTYQVTLQVKDTLALVAMKTVEIYVALGLDPGSPGPAHTPFQIPGAICDSVVDPMRPYIYATDKYAHKVYFINTATGLIEKQFDFNYMTESLAMTADGSRLYVALLTREHDYTWWDETGHVGYIAGFDLNAQVKDCQYMINEDPYDLVATMSGYLVVSSGSGQWSYVRSYEALDGTPLGAVGPQVRYQSHLTLSPSDSIVYATDTDVSPSDVRRFDISPNGGLVDVGDSPYHGDHNFGGKVWCSPIQNFMVSRGGDVFTAGMPFSSDMRYMKTMTTSAITTLEWDVARNAIFTGEGSIIRYYEFTAQTKIEGQRTLGMPIAMVGVQGSNVIAVMTPGMTSTTIMVIDDIILNGTVNTPPTARLTVTPSTGEVGQVFVFNASASSDAQDTLSNLQFRWDFEGDGWWDTNWSSSPTAAHAYSWYGRYNVRLQVQDTLGLIDDATVSVTVLAPSDSGEPGPAHQPFILPYTATDAVFDPVRPYLYISDRANKTVNIVNLVSGLTEWRFRLNYTPEAMAVTPDGSRLFVCLPIMEHDPNWDEQYQSGIIASIDLVNWVKDREFQIDLDPYDIVATSNGQIVVSSGSGQWTAIRSYNGTNGVRLASAEGVYERMKMSLHPSENLIYAADTVLAPSDIYRIVLYPNGVLSCADSIYHGEHRMDGNVWCTPNGSYVITRGGDVFTAGSNASTDMRFVKSMAAGPIQGLAFDQANDCIVTIEGTWLRAYSISTLAFVNETALLTVPEFVGIMDFEVFVIDVDGPRTTIARF